MLRKARVAVFASGNGSNAVNLYQYAEKNIDCSFSFELLVCNNPFAGVLQKLDSKTNILPIKKSDLENEDWLLHKLKDIDCIVLAGFLLKIPPFLVKNYPYKIINIHPSLLPKYGGKGMYGHFVHEAVINAEESESGITIHLVNEEYDKGKHLFQAKCVVDKMETPESLAKKINSLEMNFFPGVVDNYIKSLQDIPSL